MRQSPGVEGWRSEGHMLLCSDVERKPVGNEPAKEAVKENQAEAQKTKTL